MTYDYRSKKTVIAVATELPPSAVANVVGHLALCIGHRIDGADMGHHPLIDASGITHSGISRYPVIIVTARASRLRRLIADARNVQGLYVADYPEQMLTTGHDDELTSVLSKTEEAELKYLGVALHGLTSDLHPLTGKFSLWGNTVREAA